MHKHEFEEYVELMLDNEDLETLLQRYDLTPQEVMLILWENGYIDDTDVDIDSETVIDADGW